MAGLGSGVTEAIIINPFEVVKVRMQSNRAHQKLAPSTGQVAREILKTEGYFGRSNGNGGLLNRGITATMGRHGFFNMVYFGFYHSVKNHFPAYEVPTYMNLCLRKKMYKISVQIINICSVFCIFRILEQSLPEKC